jgi:hypothetical protein
MDFLPDLAAEGANALLPKGMGKVGQLAKNSATKSFTKALGPRTGAATELLEDAVPQILDREEGLFSISPRSLEEKLIGKGPNIEDARRELRVAKSGLNPRKFVDPSPVLDAVDDVRMDKPLKETWHGKEIPADFDYAEKANEAKGIVNEKLPHAARVRMKGIKPNGMADVVPMFSEPDFQTLMESIQDRARRGGV